MDIDELTLTLSLKSDADKFKILAEMMIDNITVTHSLMEMMIAYRAKGNPERNEAITKEMSESLQLQREHYVDTLYARFGQLPDMER